MKSSKILPVFCLSVFLSLAFAADIFGQTIITPVNPETSTGKAVNPDTSADKDVQDTDNPYSKKNNERYRIGFQDTLEIKVARHDDLSQVVSVGADGTIILPRIDEPIIAACKTERELTDVIRTHYADFLRNPYVNVRAIEQKSQPFAVIGAVEKPGSFYLNRRVRLLELLAFAGGQKIDKAGSKIQVARVGNLTGCPDSSDVTDSDEVQFISYNLNDVLDGKENPWMQPGDIVNVLDSDKAYVIGNVLKPTEISLKDRITLTQAIASAGGLNNTAKTDKIIIQRQEAGSPIQTELAYDLKEIREKKISDPVLQANDIVRVSNDNVKSVKSSLLKIITGGAPTLFYKIPLP